MNKVLVVGGGGFIGTRLVTELKERNYDVTVVDLFWFGDYLPDGVDWSVFDWAVNSGPARAATALQRCVGATVDGVIGPKTVGHVVDIPAEKTIEFLAMEREKFYRSLNTFDTFGKGWLRRNEETREKAVEMAFKEKNNG